MAANKPTALVTASSQKVVAALAPKSFLAKLLEMVGLSMASFVVFYAMVRFLNKSLSADSMSFLLKKDEKKKFKLKDHWAGTLPEQAQEILDIFNYPEVYAHFETQLPKGILLYGLPGTGKTHFARVIAEMTNSAFLYASASQFDEVFVGKGAQRVRNLFETAEDMCRYSKWETFVASMRGIKLPPKKVVIFIDELDSIGTRNNFNGLNSSNHATVSQLLTCLDGLTSSNNIFVIAATNNLETIDPALRRSGRFDRAIEMPLPDDRSRLDLISFYLSGRPGVKELEETGVLKRFGDLTKGFSAADLKNFASEVLMCAVKNTIDDKKSRKPLPKTSSSAQSEPLITENHLKHAFNMIAQKLSKERKGFKPQLLVIPTEEDSVD